jgi:hypothetical protein
VTPDGSPDVTVSPVGDIEWRASFRWLGAALVGLFLGFAIFGLVVLALGKAVFSGTSVERPLGLFYVLALGGVGWACSRAFLHPFLRATASGITVRNFGGPIFVPWNAFADCAVPRSYLWLARSDGENAVWVWAIQKPPWPRWFHKSTRADRVVVELRRRRDLALEATARDEGIVSGMVEPGAAVRGQERRDRVLYAIVIAVVALTMFAYLDGTVPVPLVKAAKFGNGNGIARRLGCVNPTDVTHRPPESKWVPVEQLLCDVGDSDVDIAVYANTSAALRSVEGYHRSVPCVVLEGAGPSEVYSVRGYDFSVYVVPPAPSDNASARVTIDRLGLPVTSTKC